MTALSALVLVVDDRMEDALLAKTILEAQGHRIVIETSGERAIQILSGPAEFDLTLLDLLMPDVNGEQVFRALKAFAPARLKRLMFFTGMGYLVGGWLSQTGIPVIEKGPESPDALIRAVRQFAQLNCSRGPRETREEKMPKQSSQPDLASLIDDDIEVDTDMIDHAQKRGASREMMTELRIKHLHSSHGALKTDVATMKTDIGSVKTDVTSVKTDVGTLKTEITTTIKTSTRWVATIIVLAGLTAWVLEHFVLKQDLPREHHSEPATQSPVPK
jgi:CheY-like chemotaxis protein